MYEQNMIRSKIDFLKFLMRENKSDSDNPFDVGSDASETLWAIQFTVSPGRNCNAHQFIGWNEGPANITNTNTRLTSFCTNDMVIIVVGYKRVFKWHAFLLVDHVELSMLQIVRKYVLTDTSIAHCSGSHTNCNWLRGQFNWFDVIRKLHRRWELDKRNIAGEEKRKKN